MNNKEFCYCGGGAKTPHQPGIDGCYREIVPQDKWPVDLGNGYYLVDGHEITEYTLKQQRLYSLGNGVWTRPKDHESTNSLPDET